MRSRGVVAFAISIGLGALSGSATALAAPEVEAGALRAEVGSSSWQLRLTDRAGRTVLEQLTGAGTPGAGARALGFRTAAGWQHATEIGDARSRRGVYTATLATTDPQHSFELRLEPAGKGVIAMQARLTGSLDDVEALGIGFAARPDERYLGFGERSNAVDQRGNVVENYVADGPYQDLEYPAINLFTPAWGLRDGHSEATYFPIPWLLSTAGYGVLVDNPETSLFRLASDGADAWSAEVIAAPAGESGASAGGPPSMLSLRFFAGPTPADALRRFTRATGRQPAPPAPWALGTWYQADDDELSEIALLRAADAPLSVLQTYVHYLPCAEQAGTDQGARTAAAHAAGVAITTYFNPMVCTSYADAYERAAAAGALTDDVLRRALPLPLRHRHRRQLLGRPVRLLHRGRAHRVRPRARRGRWRRLRRLDGGFRRVHAARLGLRRRNRRHPRAQPVPDSLSLRGPRGDERRPATDRAFPALGLDWLRRLRDRGLGRRSDNELGLRWPALGRDPGAQRRYVGRRDLGLGHRRLLCPRPEPAHPRAADALGPARRRVAGDAHTGKRGGGAAPRSTPGQRPRPDRQLAPLHQAAHPALSLSRRCGRRVPPHRDAGDAPPRARLPTRFARRRGRRRVPVRPRPARGAGPRSRASAANAPTCRAGGGSTSGAAPRTGRRAAACASARPPSCAVAAISPSRRRSRSCRCSFAAAR